MIKVNPALSKLAFKYGAVAAAFTMLAFVVFYYVTNNILRNGLSFFSDFMIIGLFAFLAMKDFKQNINSGHFRFYHGMTIGFIIYVSAAVSFSIFLYFFINWIEPGYISKYILAATDSFVQKKEMIIMEFSEANYNDQLNKLSLTTSGVLVFDAFIWKVAMGMLLSPIFSIILRTRQA